MARISQYKALGTKLGSYKSTLSKVESAEYAKKHADWKAGEQKALYGQIGGSVANIIGIAKEKRLARKQEDFMAREFGIGGDKFAERVTKQGLKDNPWLEQTDEQFWADESNFEDSTVVSPKVKDQGDVAIVAGKDDPYGYEEGAPYMKVPGFDKMGVNLQKKEEAKVDYSGAVTAGQGATQYKKITSKPDYRDMIKKQIGPDTSYEDKLMAGWEAEDKALGRYPELYQDKKKGLSSPTAAETTAYEQYQQSLKGSVDLSEKSKRSGLSIDDIIRKEKESQKSGEQASQGGQTYYVDEFGNRSPSRLEDESPVEAFGAGMVADAEKQAYLDEIQKESIDKMDKEFEAKYGYHPDAKQKALDEVLSPGPSPKVTDSYSGAEKKPTVDDVSVDDRVFDNVKDAEYYDANILELDKPLPHKSGKMEAAGLKHLQKKVPGFENIKGSHFDQMFDQIMGTESAGRNIRQITQKDVDAGRKKGTGRAGGLWQMERGFDIDAEGELKGRGFQTSIQRYINMNEMFGEEVEEWVYKAQKDDTPEDLTPEQQRELVFANLFMQEQSYGLSGSLDKQGNRITDINISSEDVSVDKRYDIFRRSYQKGNYGELWARKHYAGAKPGSKLYKEKMEQFERDKGRAKMRDKPWLR